MPIPFHDEETFEELGCAGFLDLAAISQGSKRFAALLFLNARGEPLEFAFNRVELMQTVLWRPRDREDGAARRLALSLFDAATLTPSFLVCRADTISPHLFGPCGGIDLAVPVVRVATTADTVPYAAAEIQAAVETLDPLGEFQEVRLFWSPAPPEGAAARLFDRLVARGLLLEPFERAQAGLREAYPELRGSGE